MKKLVLTLAFGLSLFAAQQAHANGTGYVCKVGWSPSNTTMGSHGLIYTYVYSGPHCQGTQLAYAIFCTAGATDGTHCSLSSLYSEPQAAALFESLHRAASAGQRVTVYTTAAGNSVGTLVEFESIDGN
jgi:hypothetical protein